MVYSINMFMLERHLGQIKIYHFSSNIQAYLLPFSFCVLSFTVLRHIGQVRCFLNHKSMHSIWNLWPQAGKTWPTWPLTNLVIQTTHSSFSTPSVAPRRNSSKNNKSFALTPLALGEEQGELLVEEELSKASSRTDPL